MKNKTSKLPLMVIPYAMFINMAWAGMVEMEDEALSNINGAGTALVLQDFKLESPDAKMTVGGLKNASGQSVPIAISDLYIGGANSNKGKSLTTVNMGRLNNPWTVEMKKSENIKTYVPDTGETINTLPEGVSVVSINAPSLMASGGNACVNGFAAAGNNCSSRASEKADLGLKMTFNNPVKTSTLTMDATEVALDGTYVRLWGDKNRAQMVGESNINFYAKTLDLGTCQAGTAGCSSAADIAGRTTYITDVAMNLPLGYGKLQPLMTNINSQGHLDIELPNPVAAASNQQERNDIIDQLSRAPEGNIYIGNFNMGGTRPGPGQLPVGGYNFGSTEVKGISINYMKVTTHDL